MCLEEKDINLIREFLLERLSPYVIMLFGSAASGNMRADSDIDIAFLSDMQVKEYDLFLLAQEMAGYLGREVDLIDLRKSSTVMQAQVVGKGKLIYDGDEDRRRDFFVLALKKYARLNEEREPVLRRIKERGRIYA